MTNNSSAPSEAGLIALADAQQQLIYWWNETGRCPCGARKESRYTHVHVGGCPTAAALAAISSEKRDV